MGGLLVQETDNSEDKEDKTEIGFQNKKIPSNQMNLDLNLLGKFVNT